MTHPELSISNQKITHQFDDAWRLSSFNWRHVLRQEPKTDYKLLVPASTLLCDLTGGMAASFEKWRKEQNIFPIPTFALLPDNHPISGAGFSIDINTIWVSIPHLMFLSSRFTTESVNILAVTGESVFKGFMRHYAYLMGAEEGDHAGYRYLYPSTTSNTQEFAGKVPLPQYDAIDIEYHSLLTRKIIATQNNFPAETIASIDQRIFAAQQWRSLHV